MSHFKTFVFGLNVVLDHPFSKITHHRDGVFKYFIAKVAGPAVERCHFGKQFGGLQAFFGGHSYRPAGGREQDDIGACCLYGVHAHAETLFALRGRAVVFAYMHVHDSCSGIVSRYRLAYQFFYCIGYCGIMFFGHFRSANGGCND
ncbi:hypothetical protein SDC9_212858 [bioreactor metagenome]|uniref:Uncharacterized protein n=1 Tax=bioreactor metagenome TaxID=1076179 RepID=A0A645JQT9_9ZZZZ